jgi:hypothetical protein
MNYLDELHYKQHRLIEELAYSLHTGYDRRLKAELNKVNAEIQQIEYRLYKAC